MEKLINKVKIIVIMLIAILTIFATNVKAEDAKGTDANPYTIYEVLNGNNQFVGNVVSVTTADLTTEVIIYIVYNIMYLFQVEIIQYLNS